jgi:extradiol dioxygenase family protein
MQSQVSAGTSSITSSTAPQLVDLDYAKQYYQEIQQMFVSQEFKGADRREKKEIVGNVIYKHVEKIVGEQKAPKITGMLIDLPEAELNFSVSQWTHFEQKVMSAFQLITAPTTQETAAPGGASVSPEAQKA